VYRPQLTSVLSITHRFTGVALVAGTLLLVCWLLTVAAGPEAFNALNGFLGTWLGYIMLIGWSYALFYHLCNGVRHLVWDAGYGYELPTAYASGWAVVIVSLILTALAWIFGLAVMGGGS
jgi:succinate dehydrogenase / fumarate reductase cytochrome b subunit